MAANTQPIFSQVGSLQWLSAPLTLANVGMDGTGTVGTIAEGGANGNFIQKLVIRSLGSNVASVLRVFANNGAANSTAANNALIGEVSLPATTANSAAALLPFELSLNFVLPMGFKLNACLGTTVAAGYMVTAIGGAY